MSIETTNTFKNTVIHSMKSDSWEYLIVLCNGDRLLVRSEFIEFKEDYLYFDRIAAAVEIEGVFNSGDYPRYVVIPFSSIAYFTEQAS